MASKRWARELLQNTIFLVKVVQKWLEHFFEIRRMTPSLLSGHLDQRCQVNVLRIAAAIKDALDGLSNDLTRDPSRLTGRMDSVGVTRLAD
jgi:hypothetical protein